MIDEKKLIEDLEAWKEKCGDSPAEDAAKVMITAFIDKVKAFPKVDEQKQMNPGWIDRMMSRFTSGE